MKPLPYTGRIFRETQSVQRPDVDYALQVLLEKAHTSFYGNLQFVFENGRVKFIRCEETLKPPESL